MNMEDVMKKAGVPEQAITNLKMLDEIAGIIAEMNNDELRATIAMAEMVRTGRLAVTAD